jgi:tetratricopeptide (TPR) repeat protein
LHDYVLCEKVLSKAITLQPKFIQLFQRRSDARFQQGRYKEALSDLNIFLSMDGNNKSVYSNRALLKINMGDLQGAIDDYTYAINKWGYHVEFYYNRANARKSLKQYILSNQDIDTILHHTPFDHTARISMAENLRMAGQYRKSIEVCTTILQLNPHDFQAFRNVLGQINASQASLKQVNDIAYLTRGFSRLALQDTVGAFEDWTKAEALGNTTATLFLGTTLRLQAELFTTDTTFPQPLQFFSRIDTTKSAELSVKGMVNVKGYDSAYCEIYVHRRLVQRFSMPLVYTESNKAPVHLRPRLQAALQQYTLRLGLKSKDRDTIVCMRDSLLCGDVFAVSGQSNIVLGKIDTVEYSQYIRTFFMGTKDGLWWQASGNSDAETSVGGVGLSFANTLIKQQKVPILILNLGIEGAIIEQHFRTEENPKDPQSWYGRMLWRMQQSGAAETVKAMIWYQGESNQGEDYTEKFTKMYNAWKQDYPTLKKFYVVQIRPSNCINISNHASLREQQRTFMQKFPDVETIASAGVPMHDGCHYGTEGYITLGKQLAALIGRDFYRSMDTVGISSPNLVRAAWTNAARNEIQITFAANDSLCMSKDTIIDGKPRTFANEAFLLDGLPFKLSSVRNEKNVLFLTLPASSKAQRITYIPDKCYSGTSDGTCSLYEGPWLLTRRGVGALTFHNVLIEAAP